MDDGCLGIRKTWPNLLIFFPRCANPLWKNKHVNQKLKVVVGRDLEACYQKVKVTQDKNVLSNNNKK